MTPKKWGRLGSINVRKALARGQRIFTISFRRQTARRRWRR